MFIDGASSRWGLLCSDNHEKRRGNCCLRIVFPLSDDITDTPAITNDNRNKVCRGEMIIFKSASILLQTTAAGSVAPLMHRDANRGQ